MMTTLLASQVLLWLLVLALSVVCLALARQIGVLHDRLPAVGALSINRLIKAGAPAPALVVKSIDKEIVTIAAGKRSQLLFFNAPGCPLCKTLLPVIRAMADRESSWLDIILASDGDDERTHRSYIDRERLHHFPYILSEQLGQIYGVSRLPYAVLIDERGIVSSFGLVNSQEHLESLIEAKISDTPTIQAHFARTGASIHPFVRS